MVTRGIQEAVILEDDVVLHQDYAKFTPIFGLKFIKLGIGVNWSLSPSLTPVQTPNFGCSEAQYITLDMAEYILENLHFGHCVDIVYWAILNFVRHPLVTIPLAHQTSILEGASTTGQSDSKKEMPLGNYIQGWSTFEKFKWVELLKEFESISKVEDEFERNFGKRIQVVNAEYIKHRRIS
jgi:hypothetical protein